MSKQIKISRCYKRLTFAYPITQQLCLQQCPTEMLSRRRKTRPWQHTLGRLNCKQYHFSQKQSTQFFKWQSHTAIQTTPLLLYTGTWINLMKMMLSNRNQEQRQIVWTVLQTALKRQGTVVRIWSSAGVGAKCLGLNGGYFGVIHIFPSVSVVNSRDCGL